MFAFRALATTLSWAASTYASPLIVGLISCKPYTSGALDYSTSAFAPLGGYRTTTIGHQELTVDVENAACSGLAGQAFQFETCTSTFMNYTATPTIKYGIVKDVASGQCLVEDENNLTLQDCWYSDDSGQVLQYFAFGGPVFASTLTLVRQRYDGSNPLGLHLAPTAPPSPLVDFAVTLETPETTVENVLYLESVTSCV
ncbi:hypothetical protein CALCODRAFT_64600 [Calocera cornea HHB12733]|uniref:Ricin B lectin domain-containing protein n=1 Tax=Calocera cornea HHB12733 TaxID=1353952 RepID=A0A165DKY8_9BASI|nr:hypothetical protein CALCODRAFT_64600 [Calocera cornea HHB12733]